MTQQRPKSSGPGWVYVLTCPDFPGCTKIGGTGRTAAHRAIELVDEYRTTGAFTVVDRHPVADWLAVEQATHRMLSDRRLPRSELFRCSPAEASRVIAAAAQAHAKPWAVTAWLRWIWLHPPRRQRRPEHPKRRSSIWRRTRRSSTDGRMVLSTLAMIIASVVIWKPHVPHWLPLPIIRMATMLERLP